MDAHTVDGLTDALDGLVVPRQPLTEVVAQRLREAILSGRVRAGVQVRQDEVASRLGVSRMPIREALRQLEIEGLVEFRPHRGVFVRQLSADEVEELCVTRVALEGFAARLAMARLEPADILRLDEQVRQMREAMRRGDTHAFAEADEEFHLAIFRAARRPSLLRRITDLRQQSRRFHAAYLQIPMLMERAIEGHVGILEACRSGDVGLAEKLSSHHIAVAAQLLVDRLRQKNQDDQ